MIHWKIEGQRLYQGLSFYRPNDRHSSGVVIRIGNYICQFRYSKVAKRWFINYNKVDPKQYEQWQKEGEQ